MDFAPMPCLAPTAPDRALAAEVHRRFTAKPGAEHIASEFALVHLGALITRLQPGSVLELGAGIGTITYFLLKHPCKIPHVTSIEQDPFCVDQIASNIPPDLANRLELLSSVRNLEELDDRFDLVVVDQAVDARLYRFLSDGTWCFVEGHRSRNRADIRNTLAARGLECGFVNYHRGVRRFYFSLKWRAGKAWPRPRFAWRKILKGCWIGQVRKRAGRAGPENPGLTESASPDRTTPSRADPISGSFRSGLGEFTELDRLRALEVRESRAAGIDELALRGLVHRATWQTGGGWGLLRRSRRAHEAKRVRSWIRFARSLERA